MSLIILNEPSLYNKTKKEKEAALIKYAEHLTGRVKVYEPTSSEDWENVIKKYMPRAVTKSGTHKQSEHNIVLLGGIDRFYSEDDLDPGYVRLADLFISNRGGVVVGEKPSFDSITYYDAKSHEDAAQWADYLHKWTHTHNYKASVNFLGRGDSSPRAILFGFSLDFPGISMGGLTILGGLHSYDNFWKNCAWMRVRSGPMSRAKVQQISEELYPDAARITITENAHKILTEMGIEHEHIPGRPGKVKTETARKEYANNIFEAFTNYNDKYLRKHA